MESTAIPPSDSSQLVIASNYLSAGISIIPLRLGGNKSPALRSWNGYRKRFATQSELRRWFQSPAGIGLVCGVQSGGLEVLDFDERPDETFSAWSEQLPDDLLSQIPVVQTGGMGYHVIYRCNVIGGNTKIAMTPVNGVLIESRGEGGYVVGVGSAVEVHRSRSPYVQVSGPPLPSIPMITPEQRKSLWNAAASLDERPDPMVDYVRQHLAKSRPPISVDATTPWGDFDSRADWLDILEPAGWSTTDGVTWTRPGKQFGTSAKIVTAKDGTQVLTVFSSTAGPLAALGTGHKTWGKFAAFAALNHGGNRSSAAKAVLAMGYGRPSR